MQVEIVRASTRQKVLAEARRRLGPDPLVLSVRKQRGAQDADSSWEAVVARDTPAPGTQDLPRAATDDTPQRRDGPSLSERLREFSGSAAAEEVSTHDMLQLARRVAQLEEQLLHQRLGQAQLSRVWQPYLERLTAAGYPSQAAIHLLSELAQTQARLPEQAGGGSLYPKVREALAATVKVAPTAERVSPQLVVFTGGSGSGKTTLAAKLASDLCLGGAAEPVLGVLMPRRGVGVESLRRAARTLRIDFVEVGSAESLAQLSDEAKERPVILDSTSVSPWHEAGLREVKQLLQAAPSAEVHAVVPASHSAEDFAVSLGAFSFVGASRMSVTRLDESPYVGRVLAASSRANMPIGYLSQGPRIPDDLVRPSMAGLMDAVLRPELSVSL